MFFCTKQTNLRLVILNELSDQIDIIEMFKSLKIYQKESI